ncbi:MAG: tRNA (adenosine(37)-N6)-threonylcarbamoyltransferase complex dimerization subunit type 1 TsaB [Candidatus Margulisbacteria bacterium]|jgi:tRNA threonylcarbamoyl adenosine modification protein YeaZ|nr:tRNA (adenosine(37)-N6)-threonylcarbamoyltransferase complex dimerization subunit type 1 TsaB [Candidatus Margulisiibacteriota bacterium]
MLTLGLNFATEDLCLAVVSTDTEDLEVSVEKKYRGPTIKAEYLPDYLDELFRAAKINLKKISRLGIAIGPGAFTGLRLSLVTAKTIALALNIPLVPVSTLEALAAQHRAEADGKNIRVLLNACRGEMTTALFDQNLRRLEPDHAVKQNIPREPENFIIENRPANALAVCAIAARAEIVFDRAKILPMTPQYSHASRVNLTAKPELQHLKIGQKTSNNS